MKVWNVKKGILLIGLIVSSLQAFGESHRLQENLKLLKTSDYGYRALEPTAPAHIPGLSGESTPEEIQFNQTILSHPQKCVFQGEDSVAGEGWVNTSRIKVIPKFSKNIPRNSQEFLKACQAIKNELGPRSCSVIEIAGHANGISIGLGKIFGFRVTQGEWEHFPRDKELFYEIVDCLKSISWEKAPVVFCSCGAGSVEEDFPLEGLRGKKLHYPYKQEAQQLLSNILERQVISANGAENVQEWGKHCRNGWCITNPIESPPLNPLDSLDSLLPVPQLRWDGEGRYIR